MPNASLVLPRTPWRPPVQIVQADLQRGELQLVDGDALRSHWPLLPHDYGINLAVEAAGSTRRLPLSLYDQGRAIMGVGDGMGVGVKVTEPRAGQSTQTGCTIASAGTRVLSFAIVARLSGEPDPLSAVGRLVDACRTRGVGGERGYGVLLAGRTLLLYDVARSSAWYANNAAGVRSWLPGRKPLANLRLRVSHAKAHRWTAWFEAATDLRLGDPLFAPYGVGSTHHDAIRDAADTQAAREPACGAKKRRRQDQLARARARRSFADEPVARRRRTQSLAREVHTLLSMAAASPQVVRGAGRLLRVGQHPLRHLRRHR